MSIGSTHVKENMYQKYYPIPNIMYMSGLCCRIACMCLYYYHAIRSNSWIWPICVVPLSNVLLWVIAC